MTTYTLFGQANPGATTSGAGNNGTNGLHFNVSAACTLAGVWHYSPSGATQLPTSIGLYTVTTLGTSGTLVHSETASWSGAAGSGWVLALFSSPPSLTSGTEYMATQFRNDASNRWFEIYAVTWPVTSGIITAPKDESTSALSQGWYNIGTSLAFPTTQTSTAGDNFGMDVQVTTLSSPSSPPLVPPSPFTPMAFTRRAVPSQAPPGVPSGDTGTGAETSAGGPGVLAASSSPKALQRSSSDKIAYLYDGTALAAWWDGSSGQVRQVRGITGTPTVASVISPAEDAISLQVSNGGTSSDVWVCSSYDDASGGLGPQLSVRHGTYSAGSFTWNTSTLISGTTTASTIQSVIAWNGTYLMVFWWDGTSGTDRVSYAYTTDKTGQAGWSAAATFAGGTWSTIVQLSVRHSVKLGVTVLVYGGSSRMNYAVLQDASTPALGNWGGNTEYDQFDDSEELFGGPQLVIDESTGDIHAVRAVANLGGPSWDGVIYWHGTYSSSGSGSVTFGTRVQVTSAASSTGPADIAVAADKNSTAWVLWVDNTTQGNLAYATLASPFTSASSPVILVAGGATSNPRWPHVPAVSASQAGLADVLPVLYTDTTGPAYPVILNTSVTLPASIQPSANLLIPPGLASPMAFRRHRWPSQAPLLITDADTGSGSEGATATPVGGPPPPVSAVLIPPSPFTPMAFQRQAGPSRAPLAAADSDTASGADTGTLTVSDTDAGAGADTATLTVSGAETGTGADSAIGGPPVQAYPLTPPGTFSPMAWRAQRWPSGAPSGVPSQDTGAGGDTGAVTATAADSDTGTGADSGTVTATATAGDTGGGTDTGTSGIVVPGADAAAGADASAFGPPPVTGAGITWRLNPVRESPAGLDVTLRMASPLGGIIQFASTGSERLYVLAAVAGVTLTVGVSSLVLGEPVQPFPPITLTAGQLYAFGPFHTSVQVPGTSTIQVTLSTTSGVQVLVVQGPDAH